MSKQNITIARNAKTRYKYDKIVQHPGKFEAEPAYTPYFYDMVLNGSSDDIEYDNDTAIDIFHINNDDIAIFPELRGYKTIRLWTSEQGFTCHQLS